MNNLNQPLALVTGANQGIGFAVVELLFQQAFNVILTARDKRVIDW